MSNDLEEIRKTISRSILRMRAIERIVNSVSFEEAWAEAVADTKQEAMRYINGGNRNALTRWVKNHAPTELGAKSLRELREYAKKLGIPYSSRMDKGTVLTEIVNHERRKSAGQGGQGNPEAPHGDAAPDAAGWSASGEFRSASSVAR